LTGRNARALETSGGFNNIVASLLQQGLGPDEAMRFADALARVDSDAASKAAQQYVDPDKATLIVVGDAKQFLDELRAIRGDIEVIAEDQLDLSSASLRKPTGQGAGE